jgi:hypothetical protein
MEISRIFINPKYPCRKGLGMRAINFIFKKYPEITRWTLDTISYLIPGVEENSFFNKKISYYVVISDENYWMLLPVSLTEGTEYTKVGKKLSLCACVLVLNLPGKINF